MSDKIYSGEYPLTIRPYWRDTKLVESEPFDPDSSVDRAFVEAGLIEKPDFVLEPPLGDLIWIAVDLDGTLAEGVWTPDNPTSDIGNVKVYSDGLTGKDKADELDRAGYKIIVHTARSWTDYQNIEKWLIHNKIPFKAIVCGKLLVKEYVDDRGISAFESSWLPERNERA